MVPMVSPEAQETTEPQDKTASQESRALKVQQERRERRARLEMLDRTASQESLVRRDVTVFPEFLDKKVQLERKV